MNEFFFMNDDQSLASEDIADFDFLVAGMEALSIVRF